MYFIARYDGGVEVRGNRLGNPDTGWGSLPNKPISSLEYILPYGDRLVLEGYEEYIHMIEAFQQMGSRPIISNVFLMGKKNGLVTSYRITMFQAQKDDRYKVGDITVRCTKEGKEYHGDAVYGWRKGMGRK